MENLLPGVVLVFHIAVISERLNTCLRTCIQLLSTCTTCAYIELTTRVLPDRRGLGHEWASEKKDERERKKTKKKKKKRNRRRKFLLDVAHVASGDSAVIKARPVARASRPRGTNNAAPAPEIQQRPGSRKGLLRQVERIACAMVRTSAPRKNETQSPRVQRIEERVSRVTHVRHPSSILLRAGCLDSPPFAGLLGHRIKASRRSSTSFYFSTSSETPEDSNDEAVLIKDELIRRFEDLLDPLDNIILCSFTYFGIFIRNKLYCYIFFWREDL